MLLKVRARPNSSDWKVVKHSDDEWTVYIPYPPEDGKANTALIKYLRRYFKSVRMVRGKRSRLKIFEVAEK